MDRYCARQSAQPSSSRSARRLASGPSSSKTRSTNSSLVFTQSCITNHSFRRASAPLARRVGNVLRRAKFHAQVLTQPIDRAEQRFFDRPRRDRAGPGDFIVGHPLAVLEQKDQPLPRRQFAQPLHHLLYHHLLLQPFFGRLPRLRGSQPQLIQRDQLAQSERFLSTAIHRLHLPLMVEKGVDRDTAQPGLKARLAAETADGPVSLQPDLL